jgi:parallel beta-helix repeat protein
LLLILINYFPIDLVAKAIGQVPPYGTPPAQGFRIREIDGFPSGRTMGLRVPNGSLTLRSEESTLDYANSEDTLECDVIVIADKYGAVCDGSTDDTLAIQTAINDADGGTLCFPAGETCVVSDAEVDGKCLEIDGHSGTIIRGRGTTLYLSGGASADIIRITDSDEITIDGMKFLADSRDGKGVFLDADNVGVGGDINDVLILRCSFDYFSKAIHASASDSVNNYGIYGLTIYDSNFENSGEAISIYGDDTTNSGLSVVKDIMISNNYFKTVRLESLKVNSTDQDAIKGLLFSGNLIVGSPTYAGSYGAVTIEATNASVMNNVFSDSGSAWMIYISEYSENTVVSSNVIEGPTGWSGRGINARVGTRITIDGNIVTDAGDTAIQVYNISDIIISNNVVSNSETGLVIGESGGRCIVSNNVAYSNTTDGILLTSSGSSTMTDIELSDNYSYSNVNNGIYIKDDTDCSDDIVIRGGLLRDNGDYGLKIDATCDNTVTYDVHFDGNGSGALLDNGAGTTHYEMVQVDEPGGIFQLGDATFTTLTITTANITTANVTAGNADDYSINNLEVENSLTFTGTGRIDWAKSEPSTVTLTVGSTTDPYTYLTDAHDGNFYTVGEAPANPAINLEVGFSSVTAINWVQITGVYEGSTSHSLAIQLYNYTQTRWDTFDAMQDGIGDYSTSSGYIVENHSFFVPDDSDYISGGNAIVRFYHTMAGNATHNLYIDVVALYQ